MNFVSF